MCKTARELDSAIERLENQLEAVRAQKKATLTSMSREQLLADILHSLFCKWDHTEGCAWFYEMPKGQHDWSGHAHSRYLNTAHKVVAYCDERNISIDAVAEIMEIINHK